MDQGGPVEVEIKARVDDLEAVRQRLADRGAEPIDARREEDVYFDHPERSFADTDEALRVRETDEDVHLTYKGPKVDETTKTREEITLDVDDAEAAQRMLTALGFEAAGRVAKRRRTYALADLTVTLDRVDGLGPFVEIETIVEDDVDEAREQVLALADELGLADQERRSYLELLLEESGEAGAEPPPP
jgi:adenylate cyclase class 2